VDDSAFFRSILQQYLQPLAGSFLTAEGGTDALALLEQSPVDVVISDLNMPGMDGVELIRRMRLHPLRSVRTVPAVLITAERDPDLIARAERAGADHLVLKPVAPEDFRNLVARLCEGSAP
jgi:two-component system chemotaxis response regulator CheY